MKGTIVKIKFNAVVAKLIEPQREVRLLVSELLSYRVADAEHTRAFKNSGWDGYSSFYQMRTDSFPAGFVRFLKKKLELRGIKVIARRAGEVFEPAGPENPVIDSFGEDPRYDYQMETVRRLVNLKAMIAQVATGGGKSRIFKLACARINAPTLFVTTRKSLMYQMAAQMEDQGRKIGILGDGTWKPELNGVNFAIVDTLSSRLEVPDFQKEVGIIVERIESEIEELFNAVASQKGLKISENMLRTAPDAVKKMVSDLRDKISQNVWKKYPDSEVQKEARVKTERKKARREETINFLREMVFVTLEEAHEVSGNGFYDILNQCHKAVFRLALTATPFMKDEQEANMRLMAVTGPIGIKISEKMLIERGILATPYFYYHEPECPKGLYRGSGWQKAYKIGVVESEPRNNFIVAETKRARQYGLPVMILVQQTAHGRLLKKQLNEAGVITDFISGECDQKKRQAALDKLKDGKLNCLIGSTILDVGVDVPAVGMVILAGGGKAEVALRQRIGRGLRAKKNMPNVCFIIDFTDRHNAHLFKHSSMRRSIVAETPGFAENVLAKPFKFEDYDLKRGENA